MEKSQVMSLLRGIENLILKRQVPIFASIRIDLLSNEYLYHVSKSIILSENKSNLTLEERFIESNEPHLVSILTKPGSGKLELDDRYEFTISDGFAIKKTEANTCDLSPSHSNVPASTFILDSKKYQPNSSETMIVVEDSDIDSEGEMDADSNF